MDDPNQPSWLSESGTQPASAPAAPAADSAAPVDSLAAPAGGSTTAASNTSAADEAELPGVILTMRLANMGVSIAIVVISVRSIEKYHCDLVIMLR